MTVILTFMFDIFIIIKGVPLQHFKKEYFLISDCDMLKSKSGPLAVYLTAINLFT